MAMRVAQHGNGNGDKDGRRLTATATKWSVAKKTRVVHKDEGNDEGGKSNGNDNKEGDCKEEGNGKQ